MVCTVTFNSELGIVEINQSGSFSARDMREATAQAIALGNKEGSIKFLVDISDTIIAASFFDILSLPAVEYEKDGADRLSRIAVLLPKNPLAQEAAHFYETANMNRGWLTKLFSDRQSAVGWLLGNE